jgi:hypothetical protein
MKRISSALAVLALGMALPGTATAFFGLGVASDWQATPAHKPLPAMHFVVPEGDLARVCGTHPGAVTYGCALRVPEAHVCLVYTANDPPRWLMEHERKHCAGWDHGPRVHADTLVAAAFPPTPAN